MALKLKDLISNMHWTCHLLEAKVIGLKQSLYDYTLNRPSLGLGYLLLPVFLQAQESKPHTCRLARPEPLIPLQPVRDRLWRSDRLARPFSPSSDMPGAKLMESPCKEVRDPRLLMPRSVILGAPYTSQNMGNLPFSKQRLLKNASYARLRP